MTVETVRVDYNNEEHARDLMALLSHYALDPMGGAEALSEYTQQNLVSNLAKQQNVFSVICYKNGQAAALINCVFGFSTFAAKALVNIHDVVVHKEFRGQGLTTYLFNEVEKIAIEHGCCKLTLEVLEGNIVAQNAYKKLGFSGYELDPTMGKAIFWQKKI